MKDFAKPIVLGINTVYHETAACLMHGGQVLAFAEQERLNRIKKGKAPRVDNPGELPEEAINYCLQRAGVHWSQIDHVALSFDPDLRRPPIDEPAIAGDWGSPAGEIVFRNQLRQVPARVSELAGRDLEDRVLWVPHERAHAASTYFASPYRDAAVLCVDGIGEHATAMLAHGVETALREVASFEYPNSLGFVWEKISKFLGFGEYEAGKVMALASFGDASDLATEFSELIQYGGGSFQVALDKLLFRIDQFEPLERRFGTRRQANAMVGPREAAVAAALQQATEEILLDLAERLHAETGSDSLCLAGGVMMNCVAMGRILKDGPFAKVFVQPVAHDAGTAIGAALSALYSETDCAERWVMKRPYLGPEYSEEETAAAFRQAGARFRASSETAREAARALADGKIIGWFQGPAEAGPRALGNRSILADPRRGGSKELINLKVKHREYFRPFAPAVMAEHANDWFEIPRHSPSLGFMSFALPVCAEKQNEVPAIVHVDGTARPQVVDHDLNPAFYALISSFHELTGVPLVVNTSFNTFDEPMVCSPVDAVRTFLRTDLDQLYMGNLVADNPRTARRDTVRSRRDKRPVGQPGTPLREVA